MIFAIKMIRKRQPDAVPVGAELAPVNVERTQRQSVPKVEPVRIRVPGCETVPPLSSYGQQ